MTDWICRHGVRSDEAAGKPHWCDEMADRKASAERAALLEQVQHLEAVVERSAHYAAVGREVQKRVNRGEVEGSYLDLRGVKIPRTEART